MVKGFALNFPSRATGVAIFCSAFAVLYPLTWMLTGAGSDPEVTRLGLFVGFPISVLAVPVVSYLFDLYSFPANKSYRWNWRTTVEFLIIVPCWYVVCVIGMVAASWIRIDL